ncbi:uncharacterized protein LOC133906488 [Phragmites australis]|uniref:uncharacterized protein LOC133906488 n=1 Tax=Phragmites australis TaxID=29695 RepID=UPI002D78C96B|nr:uncharacterized protein LOC133906488 [Phragmites australis]
MIDIARAVQWWDVWQLRILVLGSLGLQWFLLLAAPMRKYIIPPLLRKIIWLAYISSDALSIYALATLFNRHARGSSACEYGGKASSLEVLWAPVILVHLGGREEITAYNIEDNELWTRHTVTLVSQVTVAVYAFYKSWPSDSDRRLLVSAILLFIVGILSFCEKPWALKRASINRLVAVSSLIEGERKRPRGLECCFAELDDRYKCWKEMPRGDASILSDGDKVQMILSDLSLYAAVSHLNKRSKKKYQVLAVFRPFTGKEEPRRWLRRAFGLIYTRANVLLTPAYLVCHVLLVPSLYIAAIVLFAMSVKQGYSRTDVRTTYILLCFTAVLDVLGVLISELLYRLMYTTDLPALCETLPAYNLIGSVLPRLAGWAGWAGWTGWLRKCATRVGLREGYFVHESNSMYRTVSEFITSALVDASRNVENADLASYRSFTKRNWTLDEDLQGKIGPDSEIRRNLCKSSFDESVLIWHIATDLVFRREPPYGFRCRPPHDKRLREICTEAISNYMAYLLYSHPEMLMTGSRQHLFTEAMHNIKSILQGKKEKHGAAAAADTVLTAQDDDNSIAEKIMRGGEAKYASGSASYPLIRDACELAKALLQIRDDKENETRWELMYRVWLGMLCYSASMCRGYLHAKSLGEGGEFLSFVWLGISLKGAKNLADKLQMPEPEDGDDKETDTQATEEQNKTQPPKRKFPLSY